MLNINQLKTDLAELRLKVAELKISNKDEIEGIENEIFELKQKLVSNHSLTKYDTHIKSEIHKTSLFITDVERIIITHS
jgi:Fe2+ transport system protein B